MHSKYSKKPVSDLVIYYPISHVLQYLFKLADIFIDVGSKYIFNQIVYSFTIKNSYPSTSQII